MKNIMSLIGILTDTKNEKIIKNILNEKLNLDKNIIIINDKNIENFKNVSFETILITNNNIIKNKQIHLVKIISNTRFLVINADIEMDLEIYQGDGLNVITFGFNPKATITASSVEEEILLCIQRDIVDINNNTIFQQELKIETNNNKFISINNLIGIATILLLYKNRKIDKK